MTKNDLITAMAEKMNTSKKDAEIALSAFTNVIADALVDGDKISLTGFMTFETVDVPERECRNPKDGTTVTVAAHRKVKVKVGKSLKDAVA